MNFKTCFTNINHFRDFPYKNISDSYSLVINDPNDIYNKLVNYNIIDYDSNEFSGLKSLKEIHEKSIGFENSKN